MYNKSQMQIARLLPILLFLIFSNVPLPLSGEFDEICAAQGPPVQRLSLRRSILIVRELQIAGLKRTAESAATDLRPRLANTFHVYLETPRIRKIPAAASSVESPSEDD
jgi:hypothetical protein